MEKLKILVIIVIVVSSLYLIYEFVRNKILKDVISNKELKQYSVLQILLIISFIQWNRDYYFGVKNAVVSAVEKEVFKRIFDALLKNSIQYVKESKDFYDAEQRFYVLQSFSNEVKENDYLSQLFSNEMNVDNILSNALLKNGELIKDLENKFLIEYGQEEFEKFCEDSSIFKFSKEKALFKFDFTKPISSHQQVKEA